MNIIVEEKLHESIHRTAKGKNKNMVASLELPIKQNAQHDYKHSKFLIKVQKELEPFFAKIGRHALFENIRSANELRIFTEHHVFAVWDFMCLLKSLQGKITTVTVPWFPPLDALGGHLINEILVEEEGDITLDGRYLSHFEIYLEAMEQLKADITGIRQFIWELRNGIPVAQALDADYIPEPARRFVRTTFDILEKKLHQVTAAFVFGRENITYKMFQPIVDNLAEKESNNTRMFKFYLQRHIVLDQTSHVNKGFRLLENLCGDDPNKWKEAEETAIYALQARNDLLNGIYQEILARQPAY